MTTLIVLTAASLLLLGLAIYLANKGNDECVPLGIISGFGLLLCGLTSLLGSSRPEIVKTFSPSQLTIETTPYRIVVTVPLDPNKEFLWKDAYSVSRAKEITGLRVTTPVNAWGVTLDSQVKVELLFSNNTAPEATTR